MPAPRALQGNAADPKQVAFAERKQRQQEELLRAALVQVMETVEGRIVMWALLERAGVYRSTFDASGSRTFYNAGRQDFGHELLALLVEHAEEGYLLMEAEARRRAKATGREAEAVQQAAQDRGQA